jgi:hypothetical protein
LTVIDPFHNGTVDPWNFHGEQSDEEKEDDRRDPFDEFQP